MQTIWDKFKDVGVIVTLAVVATIIAIVATVTPGRAEGVGTPSSIAGPISFLGSGTFSGCGVSASGAGIIGTVSEGGPGLFADGQLASVGVACDLQAGQMVFGGAVDYGWFFGDLSDIGADTDITIRGRAGFLIAPNTLLFGHVGWSRIEGDGGHLDGWKFGPGVSIKLPNSPVFLDFRYDYGVWDVPGAGDADVVSHAGVVQITYKFGAK